jgi:hypothetical protein
VAREVKEARMLCNEHLKMISSGCCCGSAPDALFMILENNRNLDQIYANKKHKWDKVAKS